MDRRGTLSHEPNFEDRFMPDYGALKAWADCMRVLGQRVVLTMGSFDLIHIGHARYLQEARDRGDVLVVGVDSDEKIRRRKGPDRPVVPEEERLEFLVHLRAVDVVTIKMSDHPKWHLIDTVRPDILIATADTYTAAQIDQIRTQFGAEVVVLERMATTSTSERIRSQQLNIADRIRAALATGLPDFADSVIATVVHPPKTEGTDSD